MATLNDEEKTALAQVHADLGVYQTWHSGAQQRKIARTLTLLESVLTPAPAEPAAPPAPPAPPPFPGPASTATTPSP